jgi:hypothetical protein
MGKSEPNWRLAARVAETHCGQQPSFKSGKDLQLLTVLWIPGSRINCRIQPRFSGVDLSPCPGTLVKIIGK